MRSSCLILVALVTLQISSTAEACGHCRRAARRCAPVTTSTVVSSSMPTTMASPQMAPSAMDAEMLPALVETPAPATAPIAAGEVQPQYDYAAQPASGEAYYYSYDSSGKLIVQQWGDWLLRGGRQAGMARPPLPVVGRFQTR